DDAVLVKRGGVWTAVPLNLPALADVDTDSVSTADTGDHFVYLGGDKGWGVAEKAPPGPVNLEGTFGDPGADVDPDAMTARFTATQRDQELNVVVDWGDETAATTIPPGQNSADHTYAWADSYSVWAHYETDASGGI